MQTAHLAILIGYLVVMLLIGAYFSRSSRVSTGDDFIFAGRALPRPVLVGTLLATWVGSGTIVGGANFAYNYGPLASFLFSAATPLGIVVLYFAAAKIRARSTYTVPELLEARYGVGVRMLGAVVILLAYVGITAYQFIGGGHIISLLTPLSQTQATLLVAGVVTFLAVGGGLLSVAWTDAASALLIVVALLVSVPIVISQIGSPADYWDQLSASSQSLTGGLSTMQLLGYFLPLFLLILADQNLYQRLTAARDQGTARSSTAGFFFGAFVVMIPVGILASAASILLPDLETGDTAVLSLASEGVVPTVIGGMVLAGALAFIVTTGTSFMLSVAGNVVYDFYVRHVSREVSDKARLKLHRLTVLGIAVLAYLLGSFFPSVLELQIHSYTIYGVAVTPAVLAVLFWPRVTKVGALASMVVGTAAVLIWEFALDKPHDWNSVLIALPLSVLALVAGSLTSRPPAIEPMSDESASGR
ncbi:solute:Na+ symporter, SSS family [Prauserella alba]|uniref:Sodium:solute symporter n=2 Tax=Prauserella alba TaxID=176898 RepID=A0ABP4FW18_9PSEU|nr:solute:Na+ symporter, SSS family [Prauserella alba]